MAKTSKTIETKPKDLKEYSQWLKKTHGVELTSKTATYYESVAKKIREAVDESSIWTKITEQLTIFGQEYAINTKYDLLASTDTPVLDTKKYDSFINKTFRKNVIENSNWPKEPDSGWILPENWFNNINDIVRTFIVVKYLDGVEYLSEKLDFLCKDEALECHVDFEAKEEGYYAAHMYIEFPCSVPAENWDTREVAPLIEIQITTQLQEVIRKLLHNYYEKRREELPESIIKWQWEYQSNEFAANYLGHILHYIEGMIMEVRSKQEN